MLAQLIAEEARYRWYGLCEEDDIMIDDIAVVAIELRCGPEENFFSNHELAWKNLKRDSGAQTTDSAEESQPSGGLSKELIV